ncbi:MAG: nuclear transport factor 2 family protein [Pyrinomonadaceae bacterium]
MRSQVIILFAVTIFCVALSGCGGTAPANSTTKIANTANTNANNPLQTTTPVTDQTTNNAPTLTPVYKAYCDAWVKKDEAALRKVYSQDTIKYFESQMKADGVKSLMKFLEDDNVSGKLCEVRNEQITGDKAIAEIRSDSYPNGIKIEFLKENGEWKMTNKSPALDAVKPSAANSNTAK